MKPQMAMWFFHLPTLVAVWTPRLSTGSLIHSLQPNSGAAARCKAEVMGIVKGRHGAIIVDSETGKGATIGVLFPALEDRRQAEEPAAKVQMEIEASRND